MVSKQQQRIAARALTACVAAAMLAGCGGTLTAPTNATQIVRGARIALAVPSHELKQCGWLSGKEQASRRLIYVSNGDEVLIFPERPHNPAPIGCIVTPVNSAHGLYVDRHGNLYVANGNNTVTVYPPGSLTASATYSTGTAGPMYPIADHKGNVFVSTGNGRVIEFLRGNPNHIGRSSLPDMRPTAWRSTATVTCTLRTARRTSTAV